MKSRSEGEEGSTGARGGSENDRREREKDAAEAAERRREARDEARWAAEDAAKQAAAAEAAATLRKARSQQRLSELPSKAPAHAQLVVERPPQIERPNTASSAGGDSVRRRHTFSCSSGLGSPGDESLGSSALASLGGLGTRPSNSKRVDSGLVVRRAPQPRPSAESVATRIGLRVSAFDELRRQANKGLRQNLDRFSDDRLERFRKKSLALDVRTLTNPGYQDPQKEMRRMRERAEAFGLGE